MQSITVHGSLCETIGYHVSSIEPDKSFQDLSVQKFPNVLNMRE